MTHNLKNRVRAWVQSFVSVTLARTPIPADALTLLSPLCMVVVLVLVARGQFLAGGLVLIGASALDMLDGALARARGNVTRLGAFLDSTLDRYSDALAFGGLLLYYQREMPAAVEFQLVWVAMIGALLTPYARARAEALGFNASVGLLERPERAVLLIAGLLTGWMLPVLWVLALLTHVTVVQRIVHVWRQARSGLPPGG
jgi:CDP-diacylglycerol--glycerol-3-phosphate 3-phosphatidyltransferase